MGYWQIQAVSHAYMSLRSPEMHGVWAFSGGSPCKYELAESGIAWGMGDFGRFPMQIRNSGIRKCMGKRQNKASPHAKEARTTAYINQNKLKTRRQIKNSAAVFHFLFLPVFSTLTKPLSPCILCRCNRLRSSHRTLPLSPFHPRLP